MKKVSLYVEIINGTTYIEVKMPDSYGIVAIPEQVELRATVDRTAEGGAVLLLSSGESALLYLECTSYSSAHDFINRLMVDRRLLGRNSQFSWVFNDD